MDAMNAMGATPVYNVGGDNDNDGFGGGGGMWIFFLFILLLFSGNQGGGLFGGGNGAAAAASNTLSNDFLYSNLNSGISRVGDQVGNGFSAMQNGMCNLGYESASNFKDLQAQMASCLIA